MSDTLDLSGRLMPPTTYYPFPTLVPNRLVMNATDEMSLADLRRLGACAEDGPDSVFCGRLKQSPELSIDPDAKDISSGGLAVMGWTTDFKDADGKPRRLVGWSAHVTGLTFHVDDEGRVFVDGPDGRVILHDPADKRWEGSFQPTVWSSEKQAEDADEVARVVGPRWFPTGKSKRWPSYAALVEARNAAREKGLHGRVPDAVKSLLAMTPMIGSDRKRTTVVEAQPRTAPDGLVTRRVGQRYTLRLDDATAKRLHGEKAGSMQAVLRYDTVDTVEATDANVGHAAMQLLCKFDTETMLTVVGALMQAYDTGNKAMRIGAADLAALRGRQLTSAKDRKSFNVMSDLLSNVVIEVTPVKSDGTKARLNLFARQGEVVAPGGKRMPLVTLNDTLYRTMLASGHGILMDRRILTANLRTHEWEVRVYAAMSTQWSLGWVVNGYAKGKRLRRSAKVVLADAGIDYDFAEERRKRGAGVVRQKLAGTFDCMVKEGWLKAWKRVKEAADPADDAYDFTPPDTLSRALTGHRTALAGDRKPVKPAKAKG